MKSSSSLKLISRKLRKGIDDDDESIFSDTNDVPCAERTLEYQLLQDQLLQIQLVKSDISLSGLLPCCIFTFSIQSQVASWNISFGQKELLRLHFGLVYAYLKLRLLLVFGCCSTHEVLHQKELDKRVSLNWRLWVEKFPENRRHDGKTIEDYLQRVLRTNWASRTEALLGFLEISPLRFKCAYGPSLKEGYVHMKTNGAEHYPFYKCSNKLFESAYRHGYRFCLKMSFFTCIICVLMPFFFVAVVYVPLQLFKVKEVAKLPDGTTEEDDTSISANPSIFTPWTAMLLGISSILFSFYVIKFFQRRLGTVRRWAVLKPSCIAAFKKRGDAEPSEVFLFDHRFKIARGSYRQGVTWMPNGLTVESMTGTLELDPGVYYTRLTSAIALVISVLVVGYIGKAAWFQYTAVHDHTPVVPFNSSFPQDRYCGFYFEAPVDLYIKPNSSDVLVSALAIQNETLEIDVLYSILGNLVPLTVLAVGPSIFSSRIPKGKLVGLSRPVDAATFIANGPTVVKSKSIGNITLNGILSTDSIARTYTQVSQYCSIGFEIAPFRWSQLNYIALTFILGVIIASTVALGLNYFVSWVGLWHAHLRRDQWMAALNLISIRNVRLKKHRYGSFAPERRNAQPTFDGQQETQEIEPSGFRGSAIEWHVDGDNAFDSICSAIEKAQHQIFIAGWWLSPDICLRRPAIDHPESKLRTLLFQKADEGVVIYVLIYREVKVVLTLDSSYTKQQLSGHRNIRVLRDPQFHLQDLGFWSHHEKIVCVDQWLAFIGGLDMCFGRYDDTTHPVHDYSVEKATWPGKDYSNPLVKDFVRVHKPDEELIDRHTTPRMPWHDVHVSLSGQPAQDVAMHFLQRWNFVCAKRDYRLRTGFCICCRTKRFRYLPKCIMPMDALGLTFQKNDDASDDGATRASLYNPIRMDNFARVESGCVWPSSMDSNQVLRYVRPTTHKPCKCQVLRSVSQWSAGVSTESSIHSAYVQLIKEAKGFIYIENQFFVSGFSANRVVRNRILEAIVDRIVRAIKGNQPFRVYILMPLLPAFEGSTESSALGSLHAVMHWQFETICRGQTSLYAELRKWTATPEEYIYFFGLRSFGVMPNASLATEQIYVHSKLMIVDDCKAIIGSANINDRSMVGDRDSEIAVVIEDVHYLPSSTIGELCGTLRLDLFKEHLGLNGNSANIMDPASDVTWQLWQEYAKANTATFESVFYCAPSNSMKNFASFQSSSAVQFYENQRLNPLKGVHHAWHSDNLRPDDYAPFTDINGAPFNMDNIQFHDYVVDTDANEGILSPDGEGWLYARKFGIFQELRLGKNHHRRREKIHHFMTDRIFAQVRRRRWVHCGVYHNVSEEDVIPDFNILDDIDTLTPLAKEDDHSDTYTKSFDFPRSTPLFTRIRKRAQSASTSDIPTVLHRQQEVRRSHGNGTDSLGPASLGDYSSSAGSASFATSSQLAKISTLASVFDDSNAGGSLRKIRGKIVEFPLEFLSEELLKPAILPHDIHI